MNAELQSFWFQLYAKHWNDSLVNFSLFTIILYYVPRVESEPFIPSVEFAAQAKGEQARAEDERLLGAASIFQFLLPAADDFLRPSV